MSTLLLVKTMRKRKPKLHAYQRAAQRLGLYRDEAYRLVNEAWSAGKAAEDLEDGPLKDYLMRKSLRKKVRLYKDTVFIFNKTSKTCITMYKLPENILLLEERNQEMKKAKNVNSKYLGLKFLNSEGQVWTVVRVSKTSYNNYRFNLSRDAENNATKTISITSKTMKKLATSYLTIEDILEHKEDLRKKNINTYRNTSWYTWSEAKSCK